MAKQNDKTSKEDKYKDIHHGHRERVRKRFIKEGSLDSFEYHQVLELLLFYAIKGRDTNKLAHKLINEYGSFHNLLNARPEDIMQRCKVSETTAVLISIIPHLCRKYLGSSYDKNGTIFMDSYKVITKYFTSLLAGKPFESFYMLCLDANKKLNKTVKISEGNVSSSYIHIDKVIDLALLYKSSFVIIGHNHPAGTTKPSESDINITNKIKFALETINIALIDHIIICGSFTYSFLRENVFNISY